MTRARYVTPGQTAERIEKTRRLVAALLVGPLSRDAIGNLLEMGPSGVRKYLTDLGARVTSKRSDEGLMCYLAVTPEQAQAYLAQLAAKPVSRPTGVPRGPKKIAALDPRRHIHIMQDDEHYSVRLHSAPAVRDPLVAALFGTRAVEARV